MFNWGRREAREMALQVINTHHNHHHHHHHYDQDNHISETISQIKKISRTKKKKSFKGKYSKMKEGKYIKQIHQRNINSNNHANNLIGSPSSLETLSPIFILFLLLHLTATTIVIFQLLLAPRIVEANMLTDFDGATFYKAPIGTRVRIACNGSHWNDENVSLVLWFKGNSIERHSVPIYTVDARLKPLNNGARHFVADSYKGRAKFVTKSWPPYLDLSPLEEEDQSEYRCRIDYRSKPRENFLIILFVIVPPKSVQIVDSEGKTREQIYGPLSESSDLTLSCLSKGGRPAPAISWKWRHKVIDDSYLSINDFHALKLASRLLSSSEQSPSWSSRLPPTQTQLMSNSMPTTTTTTTTANESNSSRQLIAPSPQKALANSNGNSYTNGQPISQANNHWPKQNPINAPFDPSLATGQLANLFRLWHSWPEFDYFSSLPVNQSNSLEGARKSLAQPTSSGWSTVARSNAGTAAVAAPGTGQQPQQVPLLLNMNVHDSITTAVNVLKLTNLGSMFAGSELDEFAADSKESNEFAQKQLALLECHATNLHYDLRSLIKMFAPPSLYNATKVNSLFQADFGNIIDKQTQLGLAVERAIELSLVGSELTNHQAATQDHFQKQFKLVPNLETEQLSLSSQSNGNKITFANESLDEVAAKVAIVYQQLARPHQLAAESGNLSAAPEQQQQLQQQQQQQQQNNSLVRSRLIAIDVYLRPTDVKITTSQRPLSAGQLAEFMCLSQGSRPPARLTWLLNGRTLPVNSNSDSENVRWQTSQQQQDQLGGSQSKLKLRLEPEDHRATLACRAENEKLSELEATGSGSEKPLFHLEDSRTLSVHYPPKVKLELGNNIASSVIGEGADIYFVCQVEAMPSVREITWLHNERLLNETIDQLAGAAANQDQGLVIASNNSLVLQKVRLEQKGSYACMAFNSEGGSESNKIELRVLHPPTCAMPTDSEGNVLRKAMQLHSQAKFLCQMEAEPAEVEISWYLNNSHTDRRLLWPLSGVGGINSASPSLSSREAPASDNNNESQRSVEHGIYRDQDHGQQQSNFNSLDSKPRSGLNDDNDVHQDERAQATKGTLTTTLKRLVSSQLNYSVESAADYGRLYCVARNAIGQQRRACIYEVKPLVESSISGSGVEQEQIQEQLSCLPVNVTATSVWVGCEQAPQIPDPSSKFRLAVELYARNGDQQQTGEARQPADLGRLEARLASSSLDEPLFSINNLRPATAYSILVYPARSEPLSASSLVQFTTNQIASNSASLDLSLAPSIKPIAEPHSRNSLLSALISTRSTNGQHHLEYSYRVSGSPGNKEFGQQRGYSSASASSTSTDVNWPFANLWSSIASASGNLMESVWPSSVSKTSNAINSSQQRQQANPKQKLGSHQQNSDIANQLMDNSDALMISTGCLLIAASLTVLLLLYRYSSKACSSHSAGSVGGSSSSVVGGHRSGSEESAYAVTNTKLPLRELRSRRESCSSSPAPTMLGGGGGGKDSEGGSSSCSGITSSSRPPSTALLTHNHRYSALAGSLLLSDADQSVAGDAGNKTMRKLSAQVFQAQGARHSLTATTGQVASFSGNQIRQARQQWELVRSAANNTLEQPAALAQKSHLSSSSQQQEHHLEHYKTMLPGNRSSAMAAIGDQPSLFGSLLGAAATSSSYQQEQQQLHFPGLVTKSRSSQCFQSLLNPSSKQSARVHADPKQQLELLDSNLGDTSGMSGQQRFIEFGGNINDNIATTTLDRHLISDANGLMLQEQGLHNNLYPTISIASANNNNNNKLPSSINRDADYGEALVDHYQTDNACFQTNNCEAFSLMTNGKYDHEHSASDLLNGNPLKHEKIGIVVTGNKNPKRPRSRKYNFVQQEQTNKQSSSSPLVSDESSNSNRHYHHHHHPHNHRMFTQYQSCSNDITPEAAACWLNSQQITPNHDDLTTACDDAQQQQANSLTSKTDNRVHFIELIPTSFIQTNTDGSDSSYFTDMNLTTKMEFHNSTTTTSNTTDPISSNNIVTSELLIQQPFCQDQTTNVSEQQQPLAGSILCQSITSSSLGSSTTGGCPRDLITNHLNNVSSPISLTLSTTNTDSMVLQSNNNHSNHNTIKRVPPIEQHPQQLQITSILKNSYANKTNNQCQQDNSICLCNGSQNTSKDLSQNSLEERL